MAIGPKSIRGKVTLAATAATAMAMLLILGITGYAMQQILTSMISNSLDDRLDRAQAEVAAGNYQAAIDLAGEEMMQIIDANGNILAETPNARGLAAIVTDDDDDDDDEEKSERGKTFDTLEFERVDDDDDDSSTAARLIQQGSQSNKDNQTSGSSASSSSKNSAGSTSGSTNSGGSTSGSNAGSGSTGNSGNTASRPAATPRASYDDDDDDDDDDDAAEEVREQAEKAAKEAQERAEKETEAARRAAEEEARERAEEEAEEARERAEEAAKAARQAAEADDDDDDDDDDDGDDDDDKGKAKKLALPFFIQVIRFDTVPVAALAATSAADSVASSMVDVSSAETPVEATAESSVDSSAASSTASAIKCNPAAYIDATDVFGDAGPYLVKKRQVASPDGAVTLAAVTSLASASRTARLATQLLATIFLALLCLVVAFTWNMAARTLQPVEHMRRTAESITTSNLSERIPVPTRDKDLSRLATTFNELLARVEASFNEQRRFVSDASHELKSPVAATGIMLETLRTHPEAVDTKQVVADLTAENDRLASIVGDLLTLARSDEGRIKLDAKPIDLMDVLLNEAAGVQSRSSVKIDTSAVQPVICPADAELLSHSVRNLLENAARYAKTTVKLSCSQQDACVLITVSDDGCGIAPEDRERVFDRFVSLEDARANPNSTGLGLPVARSIVERHGGTLVFADPELESGATACITLPL